MNELRLTFCRLVRGTVTFLSCERGRKVAEREKEWEPNQTKWHTVFWSWISEDGVPCGLPAVSAFRRSLQLCTGRSMTNQNQKLPAGLQVCGEWLPRKTYDPDDLQCHSPQCHVRCSPFASLEQFSVRPYDQHLAYHRKVTLQHRKDSPGYDLLSV